MTFDELKEKALCLPLAPGVYIMRDKTKKVIYVGKAKKLKNRVTQYFQDMASHTPKTRAMVSKIDDFDVVVADTEFEALVLECSLIKRFQPKYNILLKDDKGYPYLRLDMKEPYPRITMVSKPTSDGARYYGPFGSRGVTSNVLETIRLTLKLPNCGRQFPKEIGKIRPCLNYHIGQCDGWCRSEMSHEEYLKRMQRVRSLLNGDYKEIAEEFRQQMLAASDALDFELAACMRNRMNAIENLGQKQLARIGSFADMDVIGYAQTEAKACFAVLHFIDGFLMDKDYEVLPIPDDAEEAVSALLMQYYLRKGAAAKTILLPFEIEDSPLIGQLFEEEFGQKATIKVPQRGRNHRLVDLAVKNAQEEAIRVTSKEERLSGTLQLLGKMLTMNPPKRIESFDISHISGTDIVASMVVFVDGRSSKSDYKHFKLEELSNQDDYESMRQIVTRRFVHYKAGDKGFEAAPDLLLIDGGIAHAKTAVEALSALGLQFPVFGMVKDDRHRTRALVTPEGQEIRIDNQQAVFALIGNIQEETHRFAISYHRQLRSKRLRYSVLDSIPGIGPKRKQQLLKHFKSLNAIEQATMEDLHWVLPKRAALAVYTHFHPKGE